MPSKCKSSQHRRKVFLLLWRIFIRPLWICLDEGKERVGIVIKEFINFQHLLHFPCSHCYISFQRQATRYAGNHLREHKSILHIPSIQVHIVHALKCYDYDFANRILRLLCTVGSVIKHTYSSQYYVISSISAASQQRLGSISAASQQRLSSVSALYQQHLSSISAASQLHLNCISVASQQRLSGVSALSQQHLSSVLAAS